MIHNFLTIRFVSILAIVIGLAWAPAGCSGTSTHSERAVSTGPADMREVTDDLGRHVLVPVHLERVVTLAPNLTEIVFAVGAGNRVVGDTDYCDYPAEAKNIAKVGDTLQPNIERVVALHPQLVLVSTSSQLESFFRQLSEQQIPVYVTDTKDLESVFRSIEKIANLFGEQQRADELVQSLKQRTGVVENAVRNKKAVTVFCQLSPQPLYTAGKEAFVTDLIRRAGGASVTADVPGAWPRYSDEAALASRPQSIIIATSGAVESSEAEVAPALKRSPAAVNGQVYKINGDYLLRPGPRLVEGLEMIARDLHPEAFR